MKVGRLVEQLSVTVSALRMILKWNHESWKIGGATFSHSLSLAYDLSRDPGLETGFHARVSWAGDADPFVVRVGSPVPRRAVSGDPGLETGFHAGSRGRGTLIPL